MFERLRDSKAKSSTRYIMEVSFTSPRLESFMQPSLPRNAAEFAMMRSESASKSRLQWRQNKLQFKRVKLSKAHNSGVADWPSLTRDLSTLGQVKALRRALSVTPNLIDLERCCPDLVERLAQHLDALKTEMVFEVLWCYSNLTAGTSRYSAVIGKMLQRLIRYVTESRERCIAEQACWVLSHLALENTDLRDYLKADTRLLEATARLLNYKVPSLSTTVCWFLCNLSRGPLSCALPLLSTGILTPVLTLVSKHIESSECIEAIWLLSFLTENADEGLCSRLGQVYMICESCIRESVNQSLLVPVLRIISNTLQYCPMLKTSELTSLLLDKFLSWPPYVMREALVLLSNGLCEFPESFLERHGAAWVNVLLSVIDNEELKPEVCIAAFNIAAAANGKYSSLVQAHSSSTAFLTACLNTVENAPGWIKFGLNTENDENLLKAALSLLWIAKSEGWGGDAYRILESVQLQEALENCISVFDYHSSLREIAVNLLGEPEFVFS